jgi:hypothetical protein
MKPALLFNRFVALQIYYYYYYYHHHHHHHHRRRRCKRQILLRTLNLFDILNVAVFVIIDTI